MFRKSTAVLLSLVAAVLLTACSRTASTPGPAAGQAQEVPNLSLSSQSFPADGEMAVQYACERYGGSDLSPQLSWDALPEGTQSLALTAVDPDANGFVHWVVYNIPPDVASIPEGQAPQGAALGKNGFGKQAYGGPCPPSGTHHYVFRLYALDHMPDLEAGASLNQLHNAMDGHVLAQGQVTGTFTKP